MFKRKWSIALLILLCGFLYTLAQFVLSTNRLQRQVDSLLPGQAQSASSRRVIFISQELDNPFWRSIEQGALQAAGKFDMNLEYTGPLRINPEEQLSQLERAIATRPDAIIVQGSGESASRNLIDRAESFGIPVVTVDADEPGSHRLFYVGTDNLAAGKEMGQLVAEATGGKGTIGVLVGTPRADSQRLRLEGLRSVVQEYPELKIADIRSSDISRLQASEQTRSLLAAHPELKAVVGFSSLDGLGAMDAAQRLGKKGLLLFAFDDLAETKEAVHKGMIKVTLVQQPLEMGAEAVTLLNDYFHEKAVPDVNFTSISPLGGSGITESSGESGP
ncbi:sugar-binding protein [Paenibacillus rhizophilus]|uniref:Sugar ABC transporter substrate-binding protein n=1 Tax=Paenibacillus rhizophilus TaxID=1850366 RepID=A0A3N9PBE1_9BACL|nr:sugar-binding protein [Paenibacillus rhizophilus]RQW12800.1 sugar ABC transporter substrate-binding protein [Paenibacillus rhizophilus]